VALTVGIAPRISDAESITVSVMPEPVSVAIGPGFQTIDRLVQKSAERHRARSPGIRQPRSQGRRHPVCRHGRPQWCASGRTAGTTPAGGQRRTATCPKTDSLTWRRCHSNVFVHEYERGDRTAGRRRACSG
jgi:hypothetical protein